MCDFKSKWFSALLVFLVLLSIGNVFGQYVAPTINRAEKPVTGTATGWIHVEEIDGVWWFVDPDGKAFFDVAVCDVRIPADNSAAITSAKMITPYLKHNYGDNWNSSFCMKSVLRLHEWHFTSLGCWSHDSIPSAKAFNKLMVENPKNGKNPRPLRYWFIFGFRRMFLIDPEKMTHANDKVDTPFHGSKDQQEPPYAYDENTKDDYWLRFSNGRRIGQTHHMRRIPDVFNKEWQTKARQKVKDMIEQYDLVDDRNLMGYFTDNELAPTMVSNGIIGKSGGFAVWSQACGDEFVRWLKDRYDNDIKKLNKAWGKSSEQYKFESFEALRKAKPSFEEQVAPKVGRRPGAFKEKSVLTDDLYAFERHFFGTYYKFVCDAIRSVDPHHLVVSNRHAGELFVLETWKKGFFGRIVDMLSIFDVIDVNLYPQMGRNHHVKGRLQILEWLNQQTGRPIMNGECGLAAWSSGIAMARWWQPKTVDTQAQRGQGYRNIVSTAANLPFMVGFQWFKWANGSGVRGNVYRRNCGLINDENEPYKDMIQQVIAVNKALENMDRSASFKIDDIDFGQKSSQ